MMTPYRNKFNNLFLVEKILFYLLKTTIFLIYSFSKTSLYALYIILTIFGLFSTKYSILSILFLFFVIYLCIMNILLLFLLNYEKSKKYIQYLVGVNFVEVYWKNGSLSLFLFAIALVCPVIIEDFTFRERKAIHELIVGPLFEAYALFFRVAGGKIDIETGEILFQPHTLEMEEVFKKILINPEPQNGIIIDIVEEFWF